MAVTVDREPVSLSAMNIHLSFGPNVVLRGVDIDVPAGTTAAVIGPSVRASRLCCGPEPAYEPTGTSCSTDARCCDDPTVGSASAWCSSSSTSSRAAVLDNVTWPAHAEPRPSSAGN